MRIQIAKAAFWGITALLAVALAGLLGYFQGFAHTIGITDLDRSISQLIADGTQMIRDVPNHVFGAGLASTGEWLIAIASLISAAAFFAIALLAVLRISAELPLARAAQPPDLAFGPASESHQTRAARHRGRSATPPTYEYSPAALTMTAIGGTLILLIAIAHIAWTIYRHHVLGNVSILNPNTNLDTWIETARIAAGIDLIVLIACIVWLLFAMRLPTAFPWLRVLGLVTMGFAVALAFAAASISVGTVPQMNLRRPVVVLSGAPSSEISSAPDTNSGDANTNSNPEDIPTENASTNADADTANSPQLAVIVGRSASHLVLLRKDGRPILIPANQIIDVIKQQNLPQFLTSNP